MKNVIHIVSNKVWGGGEKYALDLCRALDAREDCSVAVVTRKGYPEVAVPFERAGLAVGQLPLRGGALDLLSPLVLSRILDRIESPLVLHVHNFKDALVALRARRLMKEDRSRVRVVCTRHLARPAKTGRLDRNTYRDLDAIIFVSEAARAEFLKTAPTELHSDPRLMVIPNALDLPAPPPRAEADTDTSVCRFIYAGRIAPEKGVDLLIEAFAKVYAQRPGAVTLDICGQGDSRTVMPLVKRTRALGLEGAVRWHGHVADVLPYIREASVGVVPSRAPEAFGLSALEFMSQGLPVIAANVGALPEVVRDGIDGLLVPPGSQDALADAMLRLADDASERQRLGTNAAGHAREDFRFETFLDRISSVYFPDTQAV